MLSYVKIIKRISMLGESKNLKSSLRKHLIALMTRGLLGLLLIQETFTVKNDIIKILHTKINYLFQILYSIDIMSFNHISMQIVMIFLRKMLVLPSRPLRSKKKKKIIIKIEKNPYENLFLNFQNQISTVLFIHDILRR